MWSSAGTLFLRTLCAWPHNPFLWSIYFCEAYIYIYIYYEVYIYMKYIKSYILWSYIWFCSYRIKPQLHKIGFIFILPKIESKLYFKNKDAREAWCVGPPPESTFRQSGSQMAVAGKYQRNCKYKVLEED